MQLDEALAIARASPWLSQQDRRTQDLICSRMRLMSLPKGRMLFDMEDTATELYCLVAGCAVITIAHPVQGVLNAHVMFPGRWFGEPAALGKRLPDALPEEMLKLREVLDRSEQVLYRSFVDTRWFVWSCFWQMYFQRICTLSIGKTRPASHLKSVFHPLSLPWDARSQELIAMLEMSRLSLIKQTEDAAAKRAHRRECLELIYARSTRAQQFAAAVGYFNPEYVRVDRVLARRPRADGGGRGGSGMAAAEGAGASRGCCAQSATLGTG